MDQNARAPLLSVWGVATWFPRTVALDHVDLDIHAGRVVTLIGENGARKSTLWPCRDLCAHRRDEDVVRCTVCPGKPG